MASPPCLPGPWTPVHHGTTVMSFKSQPATLSNKSQPAILFKSQPATLSNSLAWDESGPLMACQEDCPKWTTLTS